MPIGGEVHYRTRRSSEVVQSIEPKIVIPMHYKMPGLNAEALKSLPVPEEFLEDLALPVTNEAKLIVKEPILEDPRVFVLTPANG